MDASEARTEFLDQVERDLETAASTAAGYRRQYRKIAVGAVVSGGIATALTGGVAAGGPDLADALGGWRLVCAIAAVAAATAAVLAGLQERLRTPEDVAAAEACVAQLTALRFSLASGATDLETHQSEYREILRKYSRFIAAG